MKKIIAWLLILGLTAAIFTGCGKKETSLADKLEQLPAAEKTETLPVKQETPEVSQPEAEQEEEIKETEQPEQTEPEVLDEAVVYDGIYRLTEPGEEGIQTYMEVRTYREFLLLELFQTFDGSTYSFWVEEFWPDEGCVLGTDSELQGKCQEFSLMSRGDIYSAMPMDKTITFTADGLTLQYGEFEDVYVRDDSFGPYHTPEEELRQRLNEMYTVANEPAVVGCWCFWDGWHISYVNLEEDGSFHFLSKEPGCPVRAMDGVWGVNQETGDIQIVAELIGDGQYPYHVTWQWRLGGDGCLYLTDEEEYLLKQMGNDFGFWPAPEENLLNMTQIDALGYVWASYDLTGEYTDMYGTDYYYSYRLPVFLEETGDFAEINEEILNIFAPIIEQELAAMEQTEFLTAQTVDWDTYVTEDIVTLHVYSLSWEWEEHYTWYYDLRTNQRVDSGELLRRIGVDEDVFLETVRSAAEAYYVDAFAAVPEQDRENYGYYERLAWTVSDDAVNMDLPIFVDRMGDLCVYAKIGSIAGADMFWAPLYPFAEWSDMGGAVG